MFSKFSKCYKSTRFEMGKRFQHFNFWFRGFHKTKRNDHLYILLLQYLTPLLWLSQLFLIWKNYIKMHANKSLNGTKFFLLSFINDGNVFYYYLLKLKKSKICCQFSLKDFSGPINAVELYCFSDASQRNYASVIYLFIIYFHFLYKSGKLLSLLLRANHDY